MHVPHRATSYTYPRLLRLASVVGVLMAPVTVVGATPVCWSVHRACLFLVARDSAPALDSLLVDVSGVVRNEETNAPIDGVRIHAVTTSDSAITAQDGRYTLRLGPGSHPLEFTHPRFRPLTVIVLVSNGVTPYVDVSLVPLPIPLARVRVNSSRYHLPRSDSLLVVGPGRHVNADGGVVWSEDALRSALQLGQPDLLRLLGTVPSVATEGVSPSSVHIGGGSADQNLVLLDGIPIENAVHSGWATSAIDPGAVQRMTLYTDHTPARFGGRLSGVIELETRGTPDHADAGAAVDTIASGLAPRPVLSGVVGYREIGVLASGGSTAAGATGIISVRHSPDALSDLWPQASSKSSNGSEFLHHTGWFDGLARGSIRTAGGTLSAVAFQSHDVARFGDAPVPFTTPTGLEWMSSAVGGTWTGGLKGIDNSILTVRAWQSSAETHGAWSVSSARLTLLTNALTQGGASADIHSTHERVDVRSGISSERFRTSYITTPYTASQQNIISVDPTSRLALTGLLATTSAYTDVRWLVSDHITVLPGARVTYRSQSRKSGWQLEPRIGVALAPDPRLHLAAYYSRTSQQLQSLRNEENVFDGTVGLNLLVVQNDQIPMATSTTLSGTMTAELSRTVTVTAGTYGRRLRDIVVAPHTGDAPFLSDSLASGDGFARGWYATLARTTPRLTMEGGLRLMITRFSTRLGSYQPGFASTRFASLALGWRADRLTEFHTFLAASGGRRAPLTQVRFQTGTTGQPDGSAQTVSPGSQTLPPYLNMNAGMSRDISFTRLGLPKNAGIRVFGAVDNVFNRTNAIGAFGDFGETFPSSLIPSRPRSYTAGLEWRW